MKDIDAIKLAAAEAKAIRTALERSGLVGDAVRDLVKLEDRLREHLGKNT